MTFKHTGLAADKLAWRYSKTLVRQRLRVMQAQYWDSICADITYKEKVGDARAYFDAIKQTYGKQKASNSVTLLLKKDGSVTQNEQEFMERLTEYASELLN